MRKTVKFISWMLGTVAVLLVVIVAAVPLLFDPNDHKDEIVVLARQYTGRDMLKLEMPPASRSRFSRRSTNCSCA